MDRAILIVVRQSGWREVMRTKMMISNPVYECLPTAKSCARSGECHVMSWSSALLQRSDPNMENWKETSRNKEIDGNRRKTRKGRMTEQIRRQRREVERMEIVIEHTEMVGNRRECHGKAGERWGRFEKVRYMTVPSKSLGWIGLTETRGRS